MGDQLGDAARFLLLPLCRPELPKLFSIENFYAAQSALSEEQEDRGTWIDTEEDASAELEQARNQLFQDIVCSLFEYMQEHRQFFVSQYIGALSVAELFRFCGENALPNVLLKLFEISRIDIAGWKQSAEPIPEPKGEFEPGWCLSNLNENLLQMQEIRITKTEREPSCFTVTQEQTQRKISITDFRVEVI